MYKIQELMDTRHTNTNSINFTNMSFSQYNNQFNLWCLGNYLKIVTNANPGKSNKSP